MAGLWTAGGIFNVFGVLMKQSRSLQDPAAPLRGTAVKVKNGFFLIGLSATDADLEHNVQLLKERALIDIAVVYSNNRRAILSIQKGTPGERAFAEDSRRGDSERPACIQVPFRQCGR